MQLDQFYVSIIQLTLMDALVIGAGAGLLVSTYFGMKLKRQESGAFSWLLGGTTAIIFGTIFGWYIMNTVGYIVAWSGSPIHGLVGTDLTDWADTMAAFFAPNQMLSIGFAMMGALFGVGWGYGIGSRPDDTSIIGNLIATLGVVAILCGLLLTILQSLLVLSAVVAFQYILLANATILELYGIGLILKLWKAESPSDAVESKTDELVV
jgi:hypothetical protein